MERVYLWHPLLVHFTIGLLTTSVGLYFVACLVKTTPWRERFTVAAEINLWAGALVSALTVGAGMIAFGTAPHGDDAHDMMLLHSWLAYATFTLFALLAAISAWRHVGPARPPSWMFLAGLVVALCVLSVTGFVGGELVFSHAVGVDAKP